MNIDQASAFLVGSILFGLAVCVLTLVALVVNNLLCRFWQPIKWSSYDWLAHPGRFVTPEDRPKPPVSDSEIKTTKKSVS
jgi:hypothetical protein